MAEDAEEYLGEGGGDVSCGAFGRGVLDGECQNHQPSTLDPESCTLRAASTGLETPNAKLSRSFFVKTSI
jgi:hypothetical protein